MGPCPEEERSPFSFFLPPLQPFLHHSNLSFLHHSNLFEESNMKITVKIALINGIGRSRKLPKIGDHRGGSSINQAFHSA